MTIASNTVQTLVRVKGNLEAIGGELKDNAGTVVDLTGKTLKFRMVNLESGAVKVNDASADIDDATAGKASYSPSAGDVDTAGEYAGYFIIDDSVDERYPYDGPTFQIVIVDETELWKGF